MNKITTLILTIVLLNSCTIQKKLHSNGYHVEWKKNCQRNTTFNTNEEVVELQPLLIDSVTQNSSVNLQSEKKEKVKLENSKSLINYSKSETILQKNEDINSEVKQKSLIKKTKISTIKETIESKAIKTLENEPIRESEPSDSIIITIVGIIGAFAFPFAANSFMTLNLGAIIAIFFAILLVTLVFSIRAIYFSFKNKKNFATIIASCFLCLLTLLLITTGLLLIFG